MVAWQQEVDIEVLVQVGEGVGYVECLNRMLTDVLQLMSGRMTDARDHSEDTRVRTM